MEMNDIKLLATKLEEIPRPGKIAHLKMAPKFRISSIDIFLNPPKEAKQAAVMILLYPDKMGELSFSLIQRTQYNGKHSGQISFPGGKTEQNDDSLWQTALRETQEEIGVVQSEVNFIKELTPTFIPPSNFHVFPFLSYSQNQPEFIPELDEVDHIIQIPLKLLMDDLSVQKGIISASYAKAKEVPMFVFGDYEVWGATAMILSELRELLRLVK